MVPQAKCLIQKGGIQTIGTSEGSHTDNITRQGAADWMINTSKAHTLHPEVSSHGQ